MHFSLLIEYFLKIGGLNIEYFSWRMGHAANVGQRPTSLKLRRAKSAAGRVFTFYKILVLTIHKFNEKLAF